MRYQGIRLLGFCTAAALVVYNPARGAYQQGLGVWAARGLLNQPRSVVALGEDCFLVQDVGSDGAPRLTCLRLFRREKGSWEWRLTECLPFPKDADRLFGATKESFLLLHRNGDLSRWQVRRQGDEMSLECFHLLVDERLRQAIGLRPGLLRDCVELPDGALVLSYGWSVLHLVPAASADRAGAEPEGKARESSKDGRKPASWRWLVRQAPESAADTADTKARGLLVAADGGGRVLVLDTRARRLVRIDPHTGTEDILATEAAWPPMNLIPEEAHGWGDTLLVGARLAGEPTLRTLVVLDPAPGSAPGPFRASLPFIGMDPNGTFAVTPRGHLAVAEPDARGIRLIPNSDAPCEFFSVEPQADLVAPTGTGSQAEVKPVPPETKDAPSLAAKAKAADDTFRELMDQEGAEARKRTKRARKKAQERRRHEQARSVTAEPAPPMVTAPAPPPAVPAPAPPPAVPAPAPPSAVPAPADPPAPRPASGGGGTRPASVPPCLLAPGSGEPWTFAAGGDLGRGSGPSWIATAFGDWVARQRERPEREPTEADLLRDAAAGSASPLTPPQGMDPFALSRQALERTVTWMLQHADQANPPREYYAWRLSGGIGQPRFSFGCYRQSCGDRTLLEIRYLWAFARQIDADAGDALLTGELAASDGITGFRAQQDGPVRLAYGLTVVLDRGDAPLEALHPGGATRPTHLPTLGVRPQEMPPPTPESKEPGPVSRAARKSSLNVHAAEFIMPGD